MCDGAAGGHALDGKDLSPEPANAIPTSEPGEQTRLPRRHPLARPRARQAPVANQAAGAAPPRVPRQRIDQAPRRRPSFGDGLDFPKTVGWRVDSVVGVVARVQAGTPQPEVADS